MYTIEEIRLEMQKLRGMCIIENLPMAAVVQDIGDDGKTRSYAEIVTPAAVNSPRSSRKVYDISNIIQGGYKTVPIVRDDDE